MTGLHPFYCLAMETHTRSWTQQHKNQLLAPDRPLEANDVQSSASGGKPLSELGLWLVAEQAEHDANYRLPTHLASIPVRGAGKSDGK